MPSSENDQNYLFECEFNLDVLLVQTQLISTQTWNSYKASHIHSISIHNEQWNENTEKKPHHVNRRIVIMKKVCMQQICK